jgi:hypothetical protein
MKTSIDWQKLAPYGIAALGLLALMLALFAIVWPYNGADYDDWWNIKHSTEHSLHIQEPTRQFATGSFAISQYILPDRLARIYYVYL